MTRALALVGLPLALAACAGVGATRVGPVDVHGGYIYAEAAAVAPAMPLEVRGTPPDGSTTEAVAAAMRMPAGLGGRPFVAAVPDPRGPRVTLAFGAAATIAPCAPAEAAPPAAAGAPLRAGLAWCWGPRTLSQVSLVSAETAGPGDTRFGPVMAQALGELFPTQNFQDDGPRSIWVP